MSTTTQSPTFILISQKQKTEQQNEECAQQQSPLQFVSRRRLAFRPNSLKNINSANPNKIEGETNAHNTLQELDRIVPSVSTSQIQPNQQMNITNTDVDKARRILWTQQEQMTFYEALKLVFYSK